MSWLSELTSKAEALLVKLDQDAAQALQQPDGLLKGTILNQAMNNLGSNLLNESLLHSREEINEAEEFIENQVAEQTSVTPQPVPTNLVEDANSSNPDMFSPDSEQTPPSKTTIPPKKFKIRTSKAGYRSFVADKRTERKQKAKEKPATSMKTPISMLEADDIRASINQSLSEYSMKLFNSPISRREISSSTSYSSHFDNQPHLVPHSQARELDNNSDIIGLRSTPSFSIEVPEEWPSNSSEDIATRLLRHNALKKKSTFYLHRVMNRLAGSNSHSAKFITDEVRIKLGRVRLNAAGYARRLNYYFRAYPMKYVMLGYLVLMQLLVVYVLFFYQSSGSTNDLSSQVKQQQRELTDGIRMGEKNLVT